MAEAQEREDAWVAEQVAAGYQAGAAYQYQHHAAPLMPPRQPETGHAAASQPEGGKQHARKTHRRIRVRQPRRKQHAALRRQPDIHKGNTVIVMPLHLRQQRVAARKHVLHRLVRPNLVRLPQIVRKHPRPQPGKSQQQQNPGLLMRRRRGAAFGRGVGQHDGFGLGNRR